MDELPCDGPCSARNLFLTMCCNCVLCYRRLGGEKGKNSTESLCALESTQHCWPICQEVCCLIAHLRNRLPVGGGCIYVVQMFFFRPPKLWDNRSRERLNGFSWNFHQTIWGKCSLKRRAAAWRMANVDDLSNLRYDSFAITRGCHRRLRYTIMSGRIDVI